LSFKEVLDKLALQAGQVKCGKPNAINLPFRDGFLVGGLEHDFYFPQ
jgi:hypothetical protein